CSSENPVINLLKCVSPDVIVDMVVVAAVPYVMVVLVLDITDTADAVVIDARMMRAHSVQSRQLPMQLLDTVDTLVGILRTAPEAVDRSLIVNMTKCRVPFHIVQVCKCSLVARGGRNGPFHEITIALFFSLLKYVPPNTF